MADLVAVIARRLHALLALDDPEQASHAPVRRALAAGRASPARDPLTERTDLERLVALARPLVAGGRVHLLTLAPLAEAVGPAWSAIATLVEPAVDRLIRRHLGPGDLVARYEALSWLVLFPALAGDEAQLKCALIADELARVLLGETADPRLVRVRSARSVEGARLGFVEAPQLATLLETVFPPEAAVAEAPEELPTPARPGAAAPTPAQMLRDLAFVWRPLWEVRRETVALWWLRPLVRLADGSPTTPGLTDLLPGREPRLVMALDLMALARAAAALEVSAGDGERPEALVSLHHETFASERCWQAWLAQASALPAAQRGQMQFCLTDFPGSILSPRLREISGRLKLLGRGVVLSVSPLARRLRPAEETGIDTVLLDFSTRPMGERAACAAMVRISVLAKEQKLRWLVTGADSLSLASFALGQGAAAVNGAAIHLPATQPRPPFRFALADLYRGEAIDAASPQDA